MFFYKKYLNFGEIFKTQSDQKDTPKTHHIFKIFSGELAYTPQPKGVFKGGGSGGSNPPPEIFRFF